MHLLRPPDDPAEARVLVATNQRAGRPFGLGDKLEVLLEKASDTAPSVTSAGIERRRARS